MQRVRGLLSRGFAASAAWRALSFGFGSCRLGTCPGRFSMGA